jgi:hypothetical protein
MANLKCLDVKSGKLQNYVVYPNWIGHFEKSLSPKNKKDSYRWDGPFSIANDETNLLDFKSTNKWQWPKIQYEPFSKLPIQFTTVEPLITDTLINEHLQ